MGEVASALVSTLSTDQLAAEFGRAAVSEGAFEESWGQLHEADPGLPPTVDLGATNQAEDSGEPVDPMEVLLCCVRRIEALEEQVRVLQKENELLYASRAYTLKRLCDVQHLATVKFMPTTPSAFH
jgi:hypothetical protein